MTVERALLYVFLILVLGTGIWCVISPESVVRFRRRRGWPENMVSGGYFYATKQRTRIMGSLVTLVSAFSLYLLLT